MPVDAVRTTEAAEPLFKVLVVEDSRADARLLLEALKDAKAPVELTTVGTLAEAEAAVSAGAFDCVLLDLGLPDASGVDNVQRVREANRGQTVVIMTGLDSEEAALGTLQRGAQDYLVKGRYDGHFIMRVIRRAIERNKVLNEVDQLREYQYYAATHDTLTGLPNRKLFEDRARSALAQAQRDNGTFAIGYVDLDRFKPVNDTYGHAVGDALLRAVAEVLVDTVRATDTVARVGGDEFLLLLTSLKGHPDDESVATTQRLLDQLNTIREVQGNPVDISASIGLAFYPYHAHTIESMLLFADQAMYAHKRRDRGSPPARNPSQPA